MVMIMAMVVAVTMPRQMDMWPTGMPWSLGICLMRMRDRNSPEKQMGGYEHDEQQSHDSSSLLCPHMQRQTCLVT